MNGNGIPLERDSFVRIASLRCMFWTVRRIYGRNVNMRQSLPEYCHQMEMEHILTEWDAEKNGTLTPDDISYGSHRKVWWKCDKGHEWESMVSVRTNGSRCPYCAGTRPIVGQTDLMTTDPDVASEWHPTMNGSLTPAQVTRGSKKRVWWRCEKGHEWQVPIYTRIEEDGCPVCSGRKIVAGVNDLATLFPELANQWDDENCPLTPEMVHPYSNRRVWWKCEYGHKWQATINSRNSLGQGCPYCANHKVLAGFNDLATRMPKIAAQWHPTLNGGLTPDQVVFGSHKKAWWRCSEGHVWLAQIVSRTWRKTDCPVCAGKVSENRRKHYSDIARASIIPFADNP